jgi:hypothetical protein
MPARIAECAPDQTPIDPVDRPVPNRALLIVAPSDGQDQLALEAAL